MNNPTNTKKIAVLVANGFDEKHFIAVQKMIQDMGGIMKIISPNQGLVNGWNENSWGHNYAVDAQLNTALGVDYDVLVIPGGQRSNDKLKLTAHTRRFINSFMGALKPVAVMGDSLMVMALSSQVEGRTVSGPETVMQISKEAGAKWSSEALSLDGQLLTGLCDDENMDDYLSTMRDLILQNDNMNQAA